MLGTVRDCAWRVKSAIARPWRACQAIHIDAQGAGATQMADEIETMARLFGTSDGSVLDRYPRDEVEQRMFLIAQILKHTDYQLAGERAVPGRSRDLIEVVVRLTNAAGTVDVPFQVVRADDEWLIENINLEAVTMQ